MYIKVFQVNNDKSWSIQNIFLILHELVQIQNISYELI
jgi:hypothetical protein